MEKYPKNVFTFGIFTYWTRPSLSENTIFIIYSQKRIFNRYFIKIFSLENIWRVVQMFVNIFNDLLQNRSLSINKVAREANISPGLIGDYKNGNKTPSANNLMKLSDYFNVTIDYLLGKTKKDDFIEDGDFNINEIKFAMYGEVREFSEEDKKDVLEAVKLLRNRKNKL